MRPIYERGPHLAAQNAEKMLEQKDLQIAELTTDLTNLRQMYQELESLLNWYRDKEEHLKENPPFSGPYK